MTGAVTCVTGDCAIRERKIGGPRRPPKCRVAARSEAELRTETDAQVVMHTIVEEDVVADFGANTDWSGKGFEATAWIESEIGSAASQSDCIGEAGWCSCVGHGEILESGLTGHEDAERTGTGLKLGSEKSVQGAQVALHVCGRDAVAEGAGVVSFEVIAHFGLDLNARVNVEGGAPTKANVVSRRAGISEAEIFGEDSDLGVI